MEVLPTIPLHGKLYVRAPIKLNRFRKDPRYTNWRINTELLELTESYAVVKAIILDPTGTVIATGHSRQDKETSDITETSFTEVAETFAVGRALSFLGIGIEEETAPYEVCSREELAVAKTKQKSNANKKANQKKDDTDQGRQEKEPDKKIIDEVITTRQSNTLRFLAKDAFLTEEEDVHNFLKEFGVQDFDAIKKTDFQRVKLLLEEEKKEILSYMNRRRNKLMEEDTVRTDEGEF